MALHGYLEAMKPDAPDVFDLFADDDYVPVGTPLPWYPGAKMDLDDYGRHLLRHLPQGRANAIKGEDLAKRLNLPWVQTEYPLRKLVRQLVLERGWPIGLVPMGQTTGFFILDSDTDAEKYADLLERRANAILEQRDSILQGWERRMKSKGNGYNWPYSR